MSAADRFRAGEWRRLYTFVKQRGGTVPCLGFRSYLRRHTTLSEALLALPAASEASDDVDAQMAWSFFAPLSRSVGHPLPPCPAWKKGFSSEDAAALVAIARAVVEKMAGES